MFPAYKAMKHLPHDRLWCNRHGHFIRAEAFSNSTKSKAVYLLQSGYRLGDAKVVQGLNCIQCTGGPLVELECSGCSRVKALEHFSKTQRQNSDTAKCKRCIAEIENFAPGYNYDESKDEDDEESDMAFDGDTGSGVGQGGVSLGDQGYSASRSATRLTMTGSQYSSSDSNNTDRCSGITNFSKSRDAPAIEYGRSGFAKVRKGHRLVPVPKCEDDDVEYLENDDEPWEM